MSVSLKQLSAMVDIVESLATEMRALIALRQILASESVRHLARDTAAAARPSSRDHCKSAGRIARIRPRSSRPSAPV